MADISIEVNEIRCRECREYRPDISIELNEINELNRSVENIGRY